MPFERKIQRIQILTMAILKLGLKSNSFATLDEQKCLFLRANEPRRDFAIDHQIDRHLICDCGVKIGSLPTRPDRGQNRK